MTVEVAGGEGPPVRRVSVARGRLKLSPAGIAAASDETLGAAKAAALLAAKQAFLRLPGGVPVQLTHAACDFAPEDGAMVCTMTVQGFARDTIEAAALSGAAEALLAVWGLVAGVERHKDGAFSVARITELAVVQNVVL